MPTHTFSINIVLAQDWVLTGALTLVLFLQGVKLASEGVALEKVSNHLGLDDVLEDPDLVFETVQCALAVGYLPKQVHWCAGMACSKCTSFSLLGTRISQTQSLW